MSLVDQAEREWEQTEQLARRFDEKTKPSRQDQALEWSDLVPFESPKRGKPFPVDALPGLIHDAVTEYAPYGKQPVAMIASSALAAVSLCCQGHADVARDEQLVSPTSLSFVVVARSGERKTAVDGVFSKAARLWLGDQIQKARKKRPSLLAALAAWEEQIKGIRAALRDVYKQISRNSSSAVGKGKEDLAASRERLEIELGEAQTKEPVVTPEPELFYSDTTQQGLIKSIEHGLPIGALWEDEAGLLVGSVGMSPDNLLNFLTTLNKLWEAKPLKAHRSSVENRSASGKRFTVNLMMQPDVLRVLLEAKNGISRGTGFLARILISEPQSTMGSRKYSEPGPMPALEEFNARAKKLLDTPLPLAEERPTELEPPILTLLPAAMALWIEYFDSVEEQLSQTGEFAGVPDFASKSAEQAVRIAALFHVFERREGHQIDTDFVRRGIQVAAWYLSESLRLVSDYETPRQVSDANKLIDWMLREGKHTVTTTDVGQIGPYATRTKERRDPAIAVAIDYGYLARKKEGKKSIYVLNPLLTGSQA